MRHDARPVLRIAGARENNLKAIDLELPRGQLIGVVGVSGSGKSSLLFQTLAAESKARHDVQLPRPARNGLPYWPQTDRIDGLPFCLTVSQRGLHRNPRSTVATFTGLHEAFRRLVRDHGEIRCSCGELVEPTGPSQLLAFLEAAHRGRTVAVSSIVAREPLLRLGQLETTLKSEKLCRVQLQMLPWGPRRERALKGLGALDLNQIHAVFAPLSVHKVSKRGRIELEQAIERAFSLGRGALVVVTPALRGHDEIEVATDRQAVCSFCHRVHRLPDDPLLAFNSAPEWSGRCLRCEGLGVVDEVALNVLVAHPELSVDDGCFALERERGTYKYLGIREDVVRGVCAVHGDSTERAFRELRTETREALLHGMGDTRVLPLTAAGKKSGAKVRYHGLIPALIKLVKASGASGDYARSFVARGTCDQCDGTRFDNDALAAYGFRGRKFTGLMSTSIESNYDFVASCLAATSDNERRWLDAALRLLTSLRRAGLGYLGMNRSSATLSGGELQRLKIATSLHEGAVHACYILDEPSLGLHASDNRGLIATLRQLRDAGNTVIVADHDPELIAIADRIITLGPGAGFGGGEVVSAGPPDKATPGRPPCRRTLDLDPKHSVTVLGASVQNLRSIDVTIPLGGLVCLTGVSGSGKSSFAHHALYPAVEAFLASGRHSGPTWRGLDGGQRKGRIERVGQQPLSTSMVSVLATYLGIFDVIRQRFAATDAAVARGYTVSEFSFNRAEGRCPTCSGRGVVAEKQTPDDFLDCPNCGGSRYTDAVLDVLWQDLTIGDVLQLEVAEAVAQFADDEAIARPLRLLTELGVGHLQLGRPTPTLSGGEGQRLKLATSLGRLGTDNKGLVFILDEPTAGLSRSDVAELMPCFDRLLACGSNTLVVIEHDLDLVAAADWIIDFGPGAGEHGGQVVYEGPPGKAEDVAGSRTGEALKRRNRARTVQAKSAPALVEPYGLEKAEGASTNEVVVSAERFQQALRKLDLATAVDDYSELITVAPTYALRTAPASFAADAVVLDLLGVANRLSRALLTHLRPPPLAGGEMIADASEALAVARRCERAEVAFSPITAALEAGNATRTGAVSALEACARRGFERYISDGVEAPLVGVRREDLDDADLFSIRVSAGMLPDADDEARTLIERVLAAGQGWASVLEQRGKKVIDTHVTRRPLSITDRRIGRVRPVPGLLDRRSCGGCPWCMGSGRLASYESRLLIADPSRAATDPEFLTHAARELLRPVHGRLVKTLEFLRDEGVCDLLSHGTSNPAQHELLLFGYPRARFLIPGRKGMKSVDYYEWSGLFPLVTSRLHLAKDKAWRTQIEASRTEKVCFACAGTGFDWQVRCSTVFGHQLPELLAELPVTRLAKLLPRYLSRPEERLVIEALRDLEAVGLGGLTLATTVRDLDVTSRERLRAVALRYTHFAAATYHLPLANEDTLTSVKPALESAAGDCHVLVTLGEGGVRRA